MPRLPGASFLSHLLDRLRFLLRDLFDRSQVDADIIEEFRHHIEMRTDDLLRQGLPMRAARRQAHLEFGHVEGHRERSRAALGLALFDRVRASWIDVRLGLRMLAKHPLLTIVAGFALAIGIPAGLAPAHLADVVEAPLPEDPENRIRAIRLWDRGSTAVVQPTYADFERWDDNLSTFSRLAAWRQVRLTVASGDRDTAPVAAAEVTSSVFGILGRAPLLGRTLVSEDERAGAPPVVLIGHDLWRSRFGGDPEILGRALRIGETPHTVIGVMPAGFFFPAREQLWRPLRRDAVSGDGVRAPGIMVFGRMTEGVSDDEAMAEVGAIGQAERAEADGEPRIRPEVVPFGLLFIGVPAGGLESVPGFLLFQLLALLVLVIACGNVAMLIFARTATRFREFAIRTALGASRARIVSQIFVETLVLALLAAGIGVLGIDWMLGRVNLAALAGVARLPYWLSLGVSREAMLRAVGLAALSATIAGVLPALRITGKGIQQNIKRAEAGRSGIRFGGVSGALIVADIALSVTVFAVALALTHRLTDSRTTDELVGIPAEEFLALGLRANFDGLRADGAPDGRRLVERLAATQRRFVERLVAEPGVASVAVAEALPRMEHPARMIEVYGAEPPDGELGRYVRTARVDVDFFRALDTPVLFGRDFDFADVMHRDDKTQRADASARGDRSDPSGRSGNTGRGASGAGRPVVVNTVFVERILGGQDPLGRRLRFTTPEGHEPAPWQEIVGVVGHLGTNIVDPEGGPALYVPAAPGEVNPLWLAIRAEGPPEALAPRVREIAEEVDSTVELGALVLLSRVYQGDWYLVTAVAAGMVLLVGILLTLAASGVYAITSFSVSERTREIGIRRALGAPRLALITLVLRRSLVQIGLGALIGMPLAARIFNDVFVGTGQDGAPRQALFLALGLAGGIALVIGLLSCLVPARRILAVNPAEALRAEG